MMSKGRDDERGNRFNGREAVRHEERRPEVSAGDDLVRRNLSSEDSDVRFASRFRKEQPALGEGDNHAHNIENISVGVDQKGANQVVNSSEPAGWMSGSGVMPIADVKANSAEPDVFMSGSSSEPSSPYVSRSQGGLSR